MITIASVPLGERNKSTGNSITSFKLSSVFDVFYNKILRNETILHDEMINEMLSFEFFLLHIQYLLMTDSTNLKAFFLLSLHFH